MFAGSMFEHSCAPNCFIDSGRWRPGSQLPAYRALRDVADGEALSVDYLELPDTYLPTAERAELLSGWGFICKCPRCTTLPELTSAFICAACGAHELCPRKPNPNLSPATDLVCQACGATPDAGYAARCSAVDSQVRGLDVDWAGGEAVATESAEILGRYH